MAKKDYYSILGVQKNASDDELKSAYRKKALASHPDRNQNNPKAEQEFKEINEAYEVLKDKQKRSAYDQFGHAAFQQGAGRAGGAGFGGQGFPDINDIFDQMFGGGFAGGFGGRSRRPAGVRGKDKEVKLTISLLQAFRGEKIKIRTNRMSHCQTCHGSRAEKGSQTIACKTCGGQGAVRISKGFFAIQQTCPKCHGSGTMIEKPCRTCHGAGLSQTSQDVDITIPPGIDNQQQVRISGKGDDAPTDRGKSVPGDLFLHINIAPHEIFSRNRHDLYFELPISASTAILGGEAMIPTIDGTMVMVKIDKGIESGKQMRLKGKGMPVINSGGRRGDLIVGLVVETPKNLNNKQENFLDEWQKMLDKDKQLPKTHQFEKKAKEFIDQYPK